MNEIGRGIATIGIWAGVGACAFAGVDIVPVSIAAGIGTAIIWATVIF